MKLPIYLDYNATTPVDPEVLEEMLPFFSEHFGNPASNHAFGHRALQAVERAREQVAALLNAENTNTIIFTSGATESNNLALKGASKILRHKGKHVITQKTEHKSVLEPFAEMEREGFAVTRLDTDASGMLVVDDVAREITDKTILVSVMYANNEIGTIQEIPKIGALCRKRNLLFFSDAVQAVGKIPVDVQKHSIDLLSLCAHKMYGPKGIGALYITSREPPVRLAPFLHGGGHERGLRSGTLPVALIVGFGKACELAKKKMAEERARVQSLRDQLWQGLKQLPNTKRNGHPVQVLPGTLDVTFESLQGDQLMIGLADLALASGSACGSKRRETSHVLRAIGIPDALAASSVRFSIGRYTTKEEIDYTIEKVSEWVKRLRSSTETSPSLTSQTGMH